MGRNSFCNGAGSEANFGFSSGRINDSKVPSSAKLTDVDQHTVTGFLSQCTVRPIQRYMLMKGHVEECPFYERWKEHAQIWATRKNEKPGPCTYDIKESYVTRPRSPQWSVTGKSPPKDPSHDDLPIYDVRGMSHRGGLFRSRSSAMHSRLTERSPTPTPAPNAYAPEKNDRWKGNYNKIASEWCEICAALKYVLKAGGWSSVKSFLEKLNARDMEFDEFSKSFTSYRDRSRAKCHHSPDNLDKRYIKKLLRNKKMSNPHKYETNSSINSSSLEENSMQYIPAKYLCSRGKSSDDASSRKDVRYANPHHESRRSSNKSQRHQSYRYSKIPRKSTSLRKTLKTMDSSMVYQSDRHMKHYQRPTQSSLNHQQQRVITRYQSGHAPSYITQKKKPKKSEKEIRRKSTKAVRVPSKCDLMSSDVESRVDKVKENYIGTPPPKLVEVNGQFLEISPTDLYRNQLYNVGRNVKCQISSADVRHRTKQGDKRMLTGKTRYDVTADVSAPSSARFRPIAGPNVCSECSIIHRSTTRRLR